MAATRCHLMIGTEQHRNSYIHILTHHLNVRHQATTNTIYYYINHHKYLFLCKSQISKVQTKKTNSKLSELQLLYQQLKQSNEITYQKQKKYHERKRKPATAKQSISVRNTYKHENHVSKCFNTSWICSIVNQLVHNNKFTHLHKYNSVTAQQVTDDMTLM